MRHSELDFEKRCRSEARRRGWRCWKNVPTGCKGLPDDSFMTPDGRHIILVEFKRPDGGGRVSDAQKLWQQSSELVHIIDNFDDFVKLLDRF